MQFFFFTLRNIFFFVQFKVSSEITWWLPAREKRKQSNSASKQMMVMYTMVITDRGDTATIEMKFLCGEKERRDHASARGKKHNRASSALSVWIKNKFESIFFAKGDESDYISQQNLVIFIYIIICVFNISFSKVPRKRTRQGSSVTSSYLCMLCMGG